MKRRCPLLIAAAFTAMLPVVETCAQRLDYSPYPPYPVRRYRAVARDGPFRVQRYRGGQGLNPEVVAQIPGIIMSVGGIVTPLVTAGSPGSPSREQAAFADDKLDNLVNSTRHQGHINRLDRMQDDADALLISLGSTPIARTQPKTSERPNGDESLTTIPLRVARHSSVSLTFGEVEQILSAASAFLQEDADGDGPMDVEVRVQLVLEQQGNSRDQLPIYDDVSGRSGTIHLPEHLADLRRRNARDGNEGYDILFCRDLRVCGRTFGAGIRGCAVSPSRNVPVVVDLTSPSRFDRIPFDAVIWTHELTHTGGAGHRNQGLALMNEVISASTNHMTRFERNALLSIADRSAAGLAASEGVAELAARLDNGHQPFNLIDSVHATFIHGIPWDNWRRRYTDAAPAPPGIDIDTGVQNDITLLKAMLANPEELEHHANVLAMLCATGSEGAMDAVISYLRDQPAPDVASEEGGRAAIDAVSAGLLYLGAIYSETRYPPILETLNTFVAASVPSETGQAALDESSTTVSISGILGLAYAGQPANEFRVPVERKNEFAALDARSFALSNEIDAAVDFAAQLREEINQAGSVTKYLSAEEAR